MMMYRALAVVEIIFHGLNKSPSAYDFFNTQQTRNFFKKRTIDIYDSSVFDQRRGNNSGKPEKKKLGDELDTKHRERRADSKIMLETTLNYIIIIYPRKHRNVSILHSCRC